MKKPYDAGAGRRVRRCVGLRASSWEKLEALCLHYDRRKSDVVERLIIAEFKKICGK